MNRIPWVDNMKAFSTIAVVLNHTHITPEIKAFAYLLCLPAFFFTAGLFTNTQLSPKEFFLKKTTRLLIPFLFWGIISWLIWFFIGRKYGNDAGIEIPGWQPLTGLLLGKAELLLMNVPLWFLCCMISLEWLYYGISQFRQAWLRWSVILLLCILGCLCSYWRHTCIWEISAAMIVLPLYAFGAEYRGWIKEHVNACPKYVWILLFICSLIGICIGAIYNPSIKLHETYIGNPLLYFLSIVAVVVFWLSISVMIERYCHHTHWLHYIGQNTLFILCTHILCFSIIKGIAYICHASLDFFETAPGCLCLWIGSFLILLPAAYIVNRYCPILVGKKRINL